MITLLLLACSDGPKSSDTADTSSIDESSLIEEETICETPTVDLSGADAEWSISTDHYRLSVSGFDEDEARQLGAIAEVGWSGLAAFFGEPLDGPLEVFIAADQTGFEAQLAEDGISGLEGAGGYYDPNTRRAYLFRQPTAYYSRVLMLHELVHQYQDQAHGISGLPTWYVEGLAEALSRHHWDGDCLQLRVRPLLSWEDAAAAAAAELDASPPDLASVLAGGSASRALSQELVRLLSSDPDLAPRFWEWRETVALGSVSAADVTAFEAAIVSVDDLGEALQAFVPQDQEPLAPIYLDWIPQGADQAWGFADASSAARIKGEVSRFSMQVDWPEAGAVGALYGYDATTGDLELALLSADGSVSRFAVIGGAVTWDVHGAVAVMDAPTWSQTADADTTAVTVGDSTVDLPRALAPAGGLALYGASAEFSKLDWE